MTHLRIAAKSIQEEWSVKPPKQGASTCCYLFRKCTILLSNVQSLRHKTDELEAWVKWKPGIKDTRLLAFTETWWGELDRDEDLNISGFGSPICVDRYPETTGKSHGGGVCLYINKRYCNTVVVRECICTLDIELLSVSLWLFYLPCEFQHTLVYRGFAPTSCFGQ